MVVNHIDKTYVTSDAATILKEVFDPPLSSNSNTPPPRCSPWHAKCRRRSAEMPPTWSSPSPESSLATLTISSRWDFTPHKSSLDTSRP